MRIAQKILSDKDVEAIFGFHQSQEWRVLKKLIDNEIVNLYKTALAANSLEDLAHFKGQMYQLRKIKSEVQRISNLKKK